jgi:DivIVA domain-containing protein
MSDLDLPLTPSADQIRRRKFATVRRGFDPDQVQDYLNQVATQFETLETDLREARMQTPASEAPVVPAAASAAAVAATSAPALSTEEAYAQLSQRFATVLRSADEEAQKLRADASAEAKKVLDEAQAEADKIRVDAQSSAEEARAKGDAELGRAREESERVLGGLDQRREALLAQMHEMQSRLLAVANDLDVPDLEPGASVATATPTPTPMPTPMPVGGQQAPGAGQSASPQQSGAKPEPPNRDATPAPPPTPPQQQAGGMPAPMGASPAAGADDDAVDPRYEDLWASAETKSVEIPDLSSLDIDFDDEE